MTIAIKGGSYCAVVDGSVVYKGSRKEAARHVHAARKDGKIGFVGLSPSKSKGSAWTA